MKIPDSFMQMSATVEIGRGGHHSTVEDFCRAALDQVSTRRDCAELVAFLDDILSEKPKHGSAKAAWRKSHAVFAFRNPKHLIEILREVRIRVAAKGVDVATPP